MICRIAKFRESGRRLKRRGTTRRNSPYKVTRTVLANNVVLLVKANGLKFADDAIATTIETFREHAAVADTTCTITGLALAARRWGHFLNVDGYPSAGVKPALDVVGG